MTPEITLLKKIEAFIKRHGINETTFGHRALNNSKFVADLRDGRELRRATREKVLSYLRTNKTPRRADPTEQRHAP